MPLKPQGLGIRGVSGRSHLSPGHAHGGLHLGTLPGNPEALKRKQGHQVSLVPPLQPLSPLSTPSAPTLKDPETDSLVGKINWENVICIT